MNNEGSSCRSLDLEALGRMRFKDLTVAEIKLLRAASTQDYAVCGPNMLTDDKNNDSRVGHTWPEDRSIRAELVRWICVDACAKALVDPQGVQVFGARISGVVDLSSVTVPFPVTLRNCRLTDGLNVGSTRISELDLQGACVESIYAYRLRVDGSVFFRNGFCAVGEVRILGAEIGGNVECDGGAFERALHADGARISGSVFLRKRFRSKGEVRLLGAVIGGNLECDGSTFENPPRQGSGRDESALNADGASVKGDVFLRRGFCSDGDVSFVGAQIGGDLDCRAARINGQLDARRAVIKGVMFWHDIVDPTTAVLNLEDASAYALYDDSPSWPSNGNLRVDGFVYLAIGQNPATARNRLGWLARLNQFSPQPYRQLAKALRDSGDEDDALEILVEMERQKRLGHFYARPASAALRWTIGYGYHPLWAFWELIGLAGLGWIIYRRAHLARAITPTDKDAYEWYKHNDAPPAHYARFSPLVFSLENSLPLVKLGQADRWQPAPDPQISVVHQTIRSRLDRFWHLMTSPRSLWQFLATTTKSPVFLRRFLWIQIILGWILATLFAAGVTGIIRN
jgi:hypothetical protein